MYSVDKTVLCRLEMICEQMDQGLAWFSDENLKTEGYLTEWNRKD